MKKIITAIGDENLNIFLKKQNNVEVIGNDIQYQEGIFEILEKNNNIDFLIFSELIKGNLLIEKIVEKIKLINNNLNIIIILENKKEELENILIAKGVYKILYNNEVEIKDFINLINKNKNNENEELKKEINNLKKLIIEDQKRDIYFNKNKRKINIIKDIIKKENNNKINDKDLILKKEIISISGPSGVGKSIISVNLAKAMSYQKNKILIMDFDILNNSLHTILGVKKYPIKIEEKLKNKIINTDINDLKIEDFIIKINKKINLISATNLLFNTKEKIDLIKIEKIINKLKNIYNTIIIDTSSECFFDFTKTIIKLSNKNIFVTETNILEIKKAKELLNIYINKWKIEKNKFNILFNKYDKNCIDINLLKELFCEFNVLGTLKYNDKYNKLINKNIKYNLINKNIRNEYLEVNKKLVLNEKGERYEFRK